MKDIEALSRKVPTICKVAPSSHYHVEDVSRAGGIIAIMGELDKVELINRDTLTVSGKTIFDVIKEHDINGKYPELSDDAKQMALAAPGGFRNIKPFSQDKMFDKPDLDRTNGCIRDAENAYSIDGGLAVLHGNIALKGCIVKTAGVDTSILKFTGKARVFDSQEQASDAILANKIKPGDIIIIRYEGPKGGPGMQEMLYPTTYLKSKNLDKVCALLTDGRFSGGTAGLSIGHVSPEAADKGIIGLVKNNDKITIDISERSIELNVSKQELKNRHAELMKKGGYIPKRKRTVSKALKLYAMFATSADMGAVRDSDKIK
jgi:dihydroxy-acid dehydratase